MICFLAPVFGQNETDAVRYSQMFYSGTSRFSSMAGAFGALGGDFSSISINPAGLGVYRTSEFTFTPTLGYNKAKSDFNGSGFEDFEYEFGLGNIGLVGTFKTGNQSGWISTSLAFGYNRTNSFDNNLSMVRENANSSFLDDFVTDANNGLTDNNLAIETGAIYQPTTGSNDYVNDFNGTYGQSQRRTITTSGHMGEYVLGLASNFDNKIFFGGSLGIQTLRYEEDMIHTENNIPNNIPEITNFEYITHLESSGTGLNFKLGTIIKPVDFLRIGGSVHTPTFWNIEENYSARMNTSLISYGMVSEKFDIESDYEITTPFRAIGSLAFVFDKFALLSFDYEFIDYTTMRLRQSGDGYDFATENERIQQEFQSTANIKVGGELRLGNISLRGGYGIYGSPYNDQSVNSDATNTYYSGGIGVNQNDFFFDIAYSYLTNSKDYILYQSPLTTSNIDYQNSRLMATLGFRF